MYTYHTLLHVQMLLIHFQHNVTVSEEADQPEQEGHRHTSGASLQQHDSGTASISHWQGDRYVVFELSSCSLLISGKVKGKAAPFTFRPCLVYSNKLMWPCGCTALGMLE